MKLLKTLFWIISALSIHLLHIELIKYDKEGKHKETEIEIRNKIKSIEKIKKNTVYSSKLEIKHAELCIKIKNKCDLKKINIEICASDNNKMCIIYYYLLNESTISNKIKNKKLNEILSFCSKIRRCQLLIFKYLLINPSMINKKTEKNIIEFISNIKENRHLEHKLRNIHKRNINLEKLLGYNER